MKRSCNVPQKPLHPKKPPPESNPLRPQQLTVTHTDRPRDTWNNGDYGFPSFHVSSTTTIAAVLDEYYGLSMSLPAYALAGLIGWSRIDQRDHDFSDVIFGAAMSYVIGKSVARHHLEDGSQIRILPSVDPSSGSVELLGRGSVRTWVSQRLSDGRALLR